MRRLSLLAVVVAVLGGAALYVVETQPSWYLRLRYPLHYASYVRVHARQNGLDPALLAAVRGESPASQENPPAVLNYVLGFVRSAVAAPADAAPQSFSPYRTRRPMARDGRNRIKIIEYLTRNGPVRDSSGRATSILKERVGYPGTHAGFTQLIAAMDRSGDIKREIRGKRTYRIDLLLDRESLAAQVGVPNGQAGATRTDGPVPLHGGDATPTSRIASPGTLVDGGGSGIDYVELAALFGRVGEILSAAGQQSGSTDGHAEAGSPQAGPATDGAAAGAAAGAGATEAGGGAWARRRMEKLEARCDSLERELAKARAEVRAVTDERDDLRSQVERGEHNLALLTEKLAVEKAPSQPSAERLGSDERALLDRLRGGRTP